MRTAASVPEWQASVHVIAGFLERMGELLERHSRNDGYRAAEVNPTPSGGSMAGKGGGPFSAGASIKSSVFACQAVVCSCNALTRPGSLAT